MKRRLKHDLETDQTQADAAIPTDQTLQDQQPTTDYEEYGPEYEEYYEEDDKKRTYSLSLLEVCMSVQTFLIMVYLGLHLLWVFTWWIFGNTFETEKISKITCDIGNFWRSYDNLQLSVIQISGSSTNRPRGRTGSSTPQPEEERVPDTTPFAQPDNERPTASSAPRTTTTRVPFSCHQEGVQYLDGDEWRVGNCTECSCIRGTIQCKTDKECLLGPRPTRESKPEVPPTVSGKDSDKLVSIKKSNDKTKFSKNSSRSRS